MISFHVLLNCYFHCSLTISNPFPYTISFSLIAVQARTVLWYLVFIGFAVNYMIRINLNITIVEMIAKKPLLAVSTTAQTPLLTNFTQSTLVKSNNNTNSIYANISSNSVAAIASNHSHSHKDTSASLVVVKEQRYSWEKQLLNSLGVSSNNYE